MRWNTAIKHLGPHDGAVISQTWCGARLEIPYSLIPTHQEHLRLVLPRETNPASELALPKVPLDIQAVEHMLWKAGYPVTGWVPGYEHFMSPYYRAEILFAILQTAREMVAESGRDEVAIAELRARVGIKERTFLLHLRNLIEDGQGLIELSKETVRLSTWQEAIQASTRIIASMQNHTHGDVILPECKLGLTESYTLCDWMVIAHSDQPFSLFQLKPPYTSVRGNATALDFHLKEHLLPGGWAATYGNNETEHSRLEQEALAKSREEA